MTVQRMRWHSRGARAVANTKECLCDNSWTCYRSPPLRNEECPQLPPPEDPTPSASSASVHDTSESSPPPRKVVCVSVGGCMSFVRGNTKRSLANFVFRPTQAVTLAIASVIKICATSVSMHNCFFGGCILPVCAKHSPKRAPRQHETFVIAFCALHWARSQRQLATMSLMRYGIVRSLT
jgi:hypothetical protein